MIRLRRLYSTLDPSKQALRELLSTFKAPVDYCFGYGSGVFPQGAGQRKKNTQIDLILGVRNSAKWHERNIEQNPHHYSSLKYLGSSAVAFVQRRLGAGVYFNPFCSINGYQVKYGIVELEDLCCDLNEWNTLYLAGRMHKPVQILRNDPVVAKAQEMNLLSAMSVALLLLPEKFSEWDLYTKVAGVSYMGDVRMALAENPNKVKNIVNNQFNLFRKLYAPLFKHFDLEYSVQDLMLDENVAPNAKGIPFAQTQTKQHKHLLLENLPEKFRIRLETSEKNVRVRVSTAVLTTVKTPSLTQSLKGVLTAGATRSLSYSYEKLRKRWA